MTANIPSCHLNYMPCFLGHYPLFEIIFIIFGELCQEKNTPTMPPLPCYEVTLENKANTINSLLQKESIVALVGMGGIGKTTLSKKMYHLFHNQYEKSSFFEDVKSKDINNVKEKLLQDLCDKKLCKDDDVDEYLDQIKQIILYQRK